MLLQAGTGVADVLEMLASDEKTPTAQEESCANEPTKRVVVVVSRESNGDDRTETRDAIAFVDAEPSKAARAELEPSARRVRLRLLLVDDNCHHRPVIADALRSQHSVATAPGMSGALRLLSTEPFDVILVVEEPGCDAFALLETVAVMWPDTHRCWVTSAATHQLGEALAMRHVSRVYAKPFDIDVFFDDLRRRSSPTIHACRSTQQGHLR